MILNLDDTSCEGGEKISKQVIKCEKQFLISLMILSLALIFNFCISSVSAASGDIIYVNGSSGNDSWDGLSWGTAKLSIKNATGTVNNGGTVNIAEGNYKGVNNTKININKNMAIIGQSQSSSIINGTNSAWIFKIQLGATVTIENLTIANGNAYNGGTIYNDGNLTVKGSIFLDNTADSDKYLEYPVDGFGGAIYNNGTLIVDDSNFTSNWAVYGGGAIYNTGDLTVTGSNFTDNHVLQTDYGGGAILNKGTLAITGSSFMKNDAYACGGAIYNDKTLNVKDSSFTGNEAYAAGGAIYNIGILTADDTSFTDNAAGGVGDPKYIPIAGGAIYNDYGGTYTVNSCQFSRNDPQDIYNVTKPFDDYYDGYGEGVGSFGDSGTTVKAASKTIPLQKTGLPLAGLITAVLLVLGGLAVPKRR